MFILESCRVDPISNSIEYQDGKTLQHGAPLNLVCVHGYTPSSLQKFECKQGTFVGRTEYVPLKCCGKLKITPQKFFFLNFELN